MIGFLLICSSKVKCEEYLKSKEINSCNLINETAVSSIIINNKSNTFFLSNTQSFYIFFFLLCGVYLYIKDNSRYFFVSPLLLFLFKSPQS